MPCDFVVKPAPSWKMAYAFSLPSALPRQSQLLRGYLIVCFQEKMEDYKKQLEELNQKVEQLMGEKASLESRSECLLISVLDAHSRNHSH